MFLRIFRHFVPIPVILLAGCEIFLIGVTSYLFLRGNSVRSVELYNVIQYPSLQLAILAGAAMVISGLYHSKAFIDYKIMALQVAFTFGFLCPIAAIGFGYWHNPENFGIPIWKIGLKVAAIWIFCILFTRIIFLALVDLNAFRRHVLVLGAGHKAARIAALAVGRNNRHFVPARFLRCGGEAVMPAIDFETNCSGSSSLIGHARELKIKEIVVATDDRRGLPIHDLLQCRVAGIDVTDYLDFIERETKSVDISTLQPGWLIFSDGFRSSLLARAIKRGCDVAFSLGLLLVTLPLMLLTALLIVLDSRGPVLYRQERAGLGGRAFVVLKFRSMRSDAEKDGAPRWAATGDARVTRVGRIIRKLRVDELPQLINVLRGDMSLVGPRPERPEFVEAFVEQIPFYAERHCVKPGITGWAQINFPYGASLEDAREKLAYDLYYVKNHGLFLDLVIVLQTIRVVLWADGAR